MDRSQASPIPTEDHAWESWAWKISDGQKVWNEKYLKNSKESYWQNNFYMLSCLDLQMKGNLRGDNEKDLRQRITVMN